MRELVKKNQIIDIIPQDFKNTNVGEVIDTNKEIFKMKLKYIPTGLFKDRVCDFYSQTENGFLYFESYISDIQENIISIAHPIKHRFLQRRKFTRIKFIEDIQLFHGDISHNITTLDISAGGMKFRTKENINIELEYKVTLPLSDDQEVTCKFQTIRIEKNDDGNYVLSGRFIGLTNIDKMTLIQFCMKKNMENSNK